MWYKMSFRKVFAQPRLLSHIKATVGFHIQACPQINDLHLEFRHRAHVLGVKNTNTTKPQSKRLLSECSSGTQ